MNDEELEADRLDDLFEHAPCGYVTAALDGRILRANESFALEIGLRQDQLRDGRRLQDLLSVGARLYFETHLMPLLLAQGETSETALELRRADGTRVLALLNANLRRDGDGRPDAIRMIVYGAGRRRRYEQRLLQATRDEREIARELQLSLLAGELPSAPDLELAIAYHAAEGTLAVGGDWYDAFWLDDDQRRLGLVVGDVVGRGLPAATTMGQLRSALRALASDGHAPGALLAGLDRYSRRYAVGAMTTLVYAELDRSTATVTFACAGHPPPLLVGPDQAPELLWDGRSEPLGAFRESVSPRPQATVSIDGAQTLLLYSDGLTERYADRTTDGLDAILQDVAAMEQTGPEPLVESLRQLQRDAPIHDDLCLLAARLKRGD